MSSAKKGKKTKGKTVSIGQFLGTSTTGSGVSVLVPPKSSWAEESEEGYDGDDRFSSERLVLPTAPRQARGSSIDLDRVPTNPPFIAFIANLPFDVEAEDIAKFFNGLKIVSLRLPREGGDFARFKGFGYVEFGTRSDLLEALNNNDEMMLNRTIRVDIAEEERSSGRREGGSRKDDDREDRSGGVSDWRAAPRDTGGDRSPVRDRPGDRGGYDRDRGYGDRDRGYGDRDRDRGFGDRDRDRGFGDRDRDRGYGGDRDRDRGYGGDRDRDRGYGGDRDRDRGYGGDRDRDRGYGDRDRDRGFGDRDRGYGDRDRGYGDRDRGYGDRNRDRGYGDRDRGYGDRDRNYGRDRYGDRGYRSYGQDRDRDRYDRQYDRGRYGGSGGGGRYGDSQRGQDRGGYSRQDDTEKKSRPVLNLMPRSKPADESASSEPAAVSANPSIFGAARPVDTTQKELEIERKLIEEKEHEPAAPPKREFHTVPVKDIFGNAKPVDTASREREIEEKIKRDDKDSHPEGKPKRPPLKLEKRDSAPRRHSSREREEKQNERNSEYTKEREGENEKDPHYSSSEESKSKKGEKKEREPKKITRVKKAKDEELIINTTNKFSQLGLEEDDDDV